MPYPIILFRKFTGILSYGSKVRITFTVPNDYQPSLDTVYIDLKDENTIMDISEPSLVAKYNQVWLVLLLDRSLLKYYTKRNTERENIKKKSLAKNETTTIKCYLCKVY